MSIREKWNQITSGLNASTDTNVPHGRIGEAGGLPERSLEKLLRAEADREAAQVLFWKASDAERAARQALGQAESLAKTQFDAPFTYPGTVAAVGAISGPRHDDESRDERTTRIAVPVEQAKKALERAIAERRRAEERLASFDFVPAVNDWLARFGSLGGFREVQTEVPVFKGDALAEIEKIRRKIAGLEARFAEVEAAPVPVETLKRQVFAEIDAIAARGELKIHPSSRSGEPLGLSGRMHIRAQGGAIVGDGGTSVLFWLLRSEMKAAAITLLSKLPQDGALTEAEREAAFREIAAQRLALERQEESLIEIAEAGGRTITRRADLDPRAFLCVADD